MAEGDYRSYLDTSDKEKKARRRALVARRRKLAKRKKAREKAATTGKEKKTSARRKMLQEARDLIGKKGAPKKAPLRDQLREEYERAKTARKNKVPYREDTAEGKRRRRKSANRIRRKKKK